MKVIFLDIDGVLNSEGNLVRLDEEHRKLGHHEVCECYKMSHFIDKGLVERLERIVQATGAKIVISSSWRKLYDLVVIGEMLEDRGLTGEVIDETPDGPNHPAFRHLWSDHIARGHEIWHWLKHHPEVERFVILDDTRDMAHLSDRLVLTDCRVGLSDADVDRAIKMLVEP